MTRGGRGQGPRRPVKGFRPGKEPPQLRRQQARQQFGGADPKQQRLIDLFADKTPEQARSMMRLWRTGLLAGAIVLAALGAMLYGWSVIATVVAFALAFALLFLWFRLRRQREALEALADAVSRPTNRKRKR